MDVTLNTNAVRDLSAVAAAVNEPLQGLSEQPEPVLAGEGVKVTSAPVDLDALLAMMRMDTNEARLNAARSRLSSALDQLTDLSAEQQQVVDEMIATGDELSRKEAANAGLRKNMNDAATKLEKAKEALKEAERELAQSGGSDPAAQAKVDAARRNVSSAESAYSAASAAYKSSSAEVSRLQTKFDSLFASLDVSSQTSLREAIRLDAFDLDHLHDEIEEDDKQHEIGTPKSVEEVISDSLKRMDDKITDEIEDRHLEHV